MKQTLLPPGAGLIYQMKYTPCMEFLKRTQMQAGFVLAVTVPPDSVLGTVRIDFCYMKAEGYIGIRRFVVVRP